MGLQIDLNTDYTGNSYDFGGSNNYTSNDDKEEDKIDLSNQTDNTSNDNSSNDFDPSGTIFDKDSSSNDSSSNIDLSDQTGNNYFDRNDNDNDSSSNDSSSSNEIDLMKDYTNNSYDPSNNSDTTKEELEKIVNERYPASKKTDFNQTSFNSKTAEEEEFLKSDGYSYLDDYNKIDYEKAKEEHRLEVEDINQITEKQRRNQSPLDILQQRSTAYQSVIDRNEQLAKNFRESQKKYSFGGFLKNTFTNVLKGGLLGGGAGAVSGGINTAVQYGERALTSDQYTEEYYKKKDQVLDDRFPNMTVQDWSNLPDGPTAVDYENNSTRYLNDDNRTKSDRYHTVNGDYVNNDNNTPAGSGGSGNGEEGGSNGDTGGNTEGISDLLTWFALNSGSDENSSGSGSNGGGSTTNVITAGSKSDDQNKNIMQEYLPLLSILGIVFGLFYLGGEN